jgi:endonuclease/exonuclease/phosphatase (EEP) superfamily protein YafD
VTPARHINVVRLRHKPTGKVITRINTQVVHHIEVAGHPRVYKGAEIKRYDEQLDRARKHIALLQETIVRFSAKGPVVFGGDLNVDYRAEQRLALDRRTPWFPLTVLSPVVTLDMPGVGTHGSREIDWSGHTEGLACEEVDALELGSSDHRAVRKTYSLAA